MGRDFFDDYGNPETKGKIVERELQRSVLLNGSTVRTAGIPIGSIEPSIFGRDNPGYIAWHDEFIAPVGGGRFLISPTFAKQNHYRPPAPPRDVGDASDMPGDDEGYEGMMR